MAKPQTGDILQAPEFLTGTPDQWYQNAETMTVAQETERDINDWFIRPFHQGFLVVQGSKGNNASAKARAANAVKDMAHFIDARRHAFVGGRITKETFNDGSQEGWENRPIDKDIVYLSDEDAAALAHATVMDAPSPIRRLLNISKEPPAWMEEKMLLANDENGERQLWARRKDARWQLAVPRSGRRTITDDVMATREPAAFDIVERTVISA